MSELLLLFGLLLVVLIAIAVATVVQPSFRDDLVALMERLAEVIERRVGITPPEPEAPAQSQSTDDIRRRLGLPEAPAVDAAITPAATVTPAAVDAAITPAAMAAATQLARAAAATATPLDAPLVHAGAVATVEPAPVPTRKRAAMPTSLPMPAPAAMLVRAAMSAPAAPSAPAAMPERSLRPSRSGAAAPALSAAVAAQPERMPPLEQPLTRAPASGELTIASPAGDSAQLSALAGSAATATHDAIEDALRDLRSLFTRAGQKLRDRLAVGTRASSGAEAPTAGMGLDGVAEASGPAYRRILGGDRAALDALAATLGGRDKSATRNWQRLLGEFFDAIRALAIDAGYINPPRSHPFWAAMSVEQGRNVLNALASLGYRIDVRGGWLDERVPSRRDISVAIQIGGVDAVRVRLWPTPEELAALGGQVAVAGADYLADLAPGLDQAEVFAAINSVVPAEDVGQLLSGWQRIRPLLLV